jgi:chaperonin GroES
MKIQPLSNNILVKRLEAQDKSKGGILLPDSAKQRPTRGQVVAIGPGRTSEGGNVIPINHIKVNDTILFTNYAGHEVEELLILRQDDVLAIVS